MERKQTSCRNCASRRRSIKAQGFCAKCYYWERKIEKSSAKLESLRSHPENVGGRSFTFEIREAKRVLEELRWREAGLIADTVDVERLDSLVRTLARCCRSECAPNAHTLIERLSPKIRRQVYEVLLPIVENLPTRRPRLHTGSWVAWASEYWNSPAFGDDVLLTRALERAYFENHVQPRMKTLPAIGV
jgi:hypothetical protein